MTDIPLLEDNESGVETDPELDKMLTELVECQKKADEYLHGWKRAKADFVNREKEMERQRKDFVAFANHTMLRDLLSVYETFVHACQSMDPAVQGSAWGKGMLHAQKNFDDFLKKEGVAKMDVIGKTFDPMHHEVVAKRPFDAAQGKKVEPDTIVEEVKAGYTLHGKPFVTPKVIISE